MNRRSPITLLKALRELGVRQVFQYGVYRFGLRSGHYRRVTSTPKPIKRPGKEFALARFLTLPDRQLVMAFLGKAERTNLLKEADEIVAGQVRLFGCAPRPLTLTSPGKLYHWTEYELGRQKLEADDVRQVWEPARFNWAIVLARAYHLSGDERYPQAFWRYCETFLKENPPYQGPHWLSAQEAALRIIALVFSWQVVVSSRHTTNERSAMLAEAIADHARRIPPTLVYARSQNNNHLLSEAAGLVTAAVALPSHPSARNWFRTGFKEFTRGIHQQIDADGAYSQHSVNYQRLMLTIALWMDCLLRAKASLNRRIQRNGFSDDIRRKLASATQWLAMMVDPISGKAPNLGPNDSASLLSLSSCGNNDYRPVVQAAALAFLGEPVFPGGAWDELGAWLVEAELPEVLNKISPPGCIHTPYILRNTQNDSWAYLRAVRFAGRPGHADQLHCDLWWCGLNIARDAGTYRYSASPPWDNALSGSAVHNTVVVDEHDQMSRFGRFLWLDRAQAKVLDYTQESDGVFSNMTVEHNGYRRLGMIHQRKVSIVQEDGWVTEDLITQRGFFGRNKIVTCDLHWLLPDWPWQMDGRSLYLISPKGLVRLRIEMRATADEEVHDAVEKTDPRFASSISLVRAGEVVFGKQQALPIHGWISTNYGEKQPALSLVARVTGLPPIIFTTQFIFPE